MAYGDLTPVPHQLAVRTNLRAGDMTEQLTLSYCHQPIPGRTNYWAHDAEVDSLQKAQQPEGFSCSVQDDILLIRSRKGSEWAER